MFSGIVGFAKYCADNSDAEGAMKIVTMLNDLYTLFDELTDPSRNPNIYKVRHISSSSSSIWLSFALSVLLRLWLWLEEAEGASLNPIYVRPEKTFSLSYASTFSL